MSDFYKNLLNRSKVITHFAEEELSAMPSEKLYRKENEKKWSVIEVIDHLNKIYDNYLDNFQNAISHAPIRSDTDRFRFQRTLLGKLSTYSMKPKGKKRKFKMKTFDFFQPVENRDSNEILGTFVANKEKFHKLIEEASTKNLQNIKMPTSLGERLKFYVPECFDFILAHEERHVIQIEDILSKID